MKLEIKSLSETLRKDYIKPDIGLVVKYQEALKENEEAQQYLRKERGLTDDTIAHFKLGYSADYDAISIPIFKDGTLVNIKYRLLHPDKAKYIGERGAETWLYNDVGIQHAMKTGGILIVEGEFDLMSVWQSGIKNVVSPASGKNSYGVWLELIDNIPRVYIAYDNDSAGKETAIEMAERVGTEKTFEVKYPDGIKDANEYFKTHTPEEFRGLLKQARPFYSHQFKGMGDIIESLRNKTDDTVKLDLVPKVHIEKDWLMIISGKSNVGKTSYVMNLADELAYHKQPTLIMPFERGIESVGRRYLQVKFDKSLEDFQQSSDKEWDKMISDCLDSPIYFALPKKDEIVDTIVKARRLFGVKFVIIDHLDYIIRHSQGNRDAEIANTLQSLKRVAEDNGIVMMIVTHIRKIEKAGEMLKRTPNIEDLKGSSSLYQDPECVIMLTSDTEGVIKVDIVKNKGEMTSKEFSFKQRTGKIESLYGDLDFD